MAKQSGKKGSVRNEGPPFGGSASDLETMLRAAIYEQDHAVSEVVGAHRRMEMGLARDGKPLASLLFLGPTGSGKTEIAKLWAEFLGWRFQRFDMSEYSESHTASALIGAPSGYVGSDKPSRLSDLGDNANFVILLDELEKAHINVIRLFLAALDAGHITDRAGRRIDFTGAVVIMTTNAASTVPPPVGFLPEIRTATDRSRGELIGDLQENFPPEFLGRIGSIVQFNRLSPDGLGRVLDKKIAELNRLGGLIGRGIELKLTQQARKHILGLALGEGLGARPVAHRLDSEIVSALACEMAKSATLRQAIGVVEVDKTDAGWEFKALSLRPAASAETHSISMPTRMATSKVVSLDPSDPANQLDGFGVDERFPDPTADRDLDGGLRSPPGLDDEDLHHAEPPKHQKRREATAGATSSERSTDGPSDSDTTRPKEILFGGGRGDGVFRIADLAAEGLYVGGLRHWPGILRGTAIFLREVFFGPVWYMPRGRGVVPDLDTDTRGGRLVATRHSDRNIVMLAVGTLLVTVSETLRRSHNGRRQVFISVSVSRMTGEEAILAIATPPYRAEELLSEIDARGPNKLYYWRGTYSGLTQEAARLCDLLGAIAKEVDGGMTMHGTDFLR